MASRKEFVEFVCSQLKPLGNITYRPMMGEYLVYVNHKYCIGICNNQVFLKPTKGIEDLLNEVILEPMYDGAKPSYLITDIDNVDYLCKIVGATYEALPEPKKKGDS